MKPGKKHSDDRLDKALGLFSEPTVEGMEAARKRVSDRFDFVHDEEEKDGPIRMVPPARKIRWAAVAGIAAAILVAILVPATALRSASAVLEDASGSRTIQFGELVRGGILKLPDGSRVEVRPESELSLQPTTRGVRVRLQKGRVVVKAAKELMIETKDMSATGTAFEVNAKEEDVRVAALESEAHVWQGAISTRLSPGEWASYPARTPQTPPREAFEEASVKPSEGGARGARGAMAYPCNGGPPRVTPGRFVVSYLSLYRLISWAYGMDCGVASQNDLIAGGPGWMRTDPYAIEALIPSGTPTYTVQEVVRGSAPKVQKMLQTLLAERFKLAVRFEKKDVSAYTLTMGKDTGRFRLSKDQTPVDPLSRQPGSRGTFSFSSDQASGLMTVSASAVSVQEILDVWLPLAGQPVVNKIDMKGLYDIPRFQFTLDQPVQRGYQFERVMEQLGFKVETAKTSMDALIIDHVERPTEN